MMLDVLLEKGLSPILSVLADHWGSPQMEFPHHDLSVLYQLCNENAPSEHPKERFWLFLPNSDPP